MYNTTKDLSSKEKALIDHVIQSIRNSQQEKSQLYSEILELPGMSNSRVRHFLNNICQRMGTSYLEIGCWQGSTFISSLYANSHALKYAVGIDNWSEFGGPIEAFKGNCKRFLDVNDFEFYHSDCFSIDLDLFKHKINTYFYDGLHTEESQYLAFKYYDSVFENVFIAIVDDWNREPVRKGTFKALKDLSYEILFEADLTDRKNGKDKSWWNGLYIAVIKKDGSQ